MADEELEIEELLLDDQESALAKHVSSSFTKSEDARRDQETRWITSYRNYRGIYGNDNQFTDRAQRRSTQGGSWPRSQAFPSRGSQACARSRNR